MEGKSQAGIKRPAEDYPVGIEKLVKLSSVELYKTPSGDELQNLKLGDVKDSFAQSDLLRLQITELLTEVSVKSVRTKEVDEYINRFIEKLKTLKSSEQYKLSDQDWLKKSKIKVPIVIKPLSVKGSFKFLPPDDVQVIGSYKLDTCIKPEPHVDLALVLPKGWVNAKDYMNQVYLRKRALYLACVAKQLLKWKDGVSSLSFSYHHGNHMKPILAIKPTGKLGNHITIRVHTTFEENHFKRSRFDIDKNNVRKSWFEETEEQVHESDETATPHYNTTMLQDMTLLHDANVLSNSLENAQGIKDGIKLLKVWLHQRGLDKGYGCMSGFIVTMFVMYLLKVSKFNHLMNAYLTFRNTLSHLSQANWVEDGISLCTSVEQSSKPGLERFHHHFPVVFVDDSGFVNLCAGMTKNTFKRVKHEAMLAVQFMDTSGTDYFDALFMKPMPFVASFDQIITLIKPSEVTKAIEKLELTASLIDFSGNELYACLDKLLQLLDEAIGRRVKLISHSLPHYGQWCVTEPAPSPCDVASLMFGFVLDHATCCSVLEKGPPAEDPNAAEFRKFWGDKSELRRFQDGTICEAVLWSCDTAAQTRGVLGRIVKYVINRHTGINTENLTVIHNQLDSVLKLHIPQKSKSTAIKSKPVKTGTGEEESIAYMEEFNRLCKCLRTVDLPLSIHATHGITPELRYTEVFPVMPATYYSPANVIEKQMFPKEKLRTTPFIPAPTVICMLEGSGKWPDDIEAIQRIKAAFLIQLTRKLNDIKEIVAIAHATHVDVLLSGYVFRVVLGYSHEITLLKRTVTYDGAIQFEDTERARQLKVQIHALPQLASALTALHHSHSTFSVSVRLAKRWVASQMLLADYVPHEAVELIIAHLHIQHAPYSLPGSALVCFVRFLQFLSTFDWKSQPLLVNLNNDFKREGMAEIHSHFHKNRTSLPIMFIATPTDMLTSQWTCRKPTGQILTRLALLARASLATLQQQLVTAQPDTDYKQIFRPPLEVYDVVIHLKATHVARGIQAIDLAQHTVIPEYGQVEANRLIKMPIIDLDLVQCYLKQIREAFGDVALFFCDRYGGHVIGMLWKPHRCKSKPFSDELVNYHMPDTSSSDVQLVPNAEAILEDLRFMGHGLVESVEATPQKCSF